MHVPYELKSQRSLGNKSMAFVKERQERKQPIDENITDFLQK
jgi:hypothetical protein